MEETEQASIYGGQAEQQDLHLRQFALDMAQRNAALWGSDPANTVKAANTFLAYLKAGQQQTTAH